MAVEIMRSPVGFCDWKVLLELLYCAFEYQKDRIDPPSSLYKLDIESISLKAQEEHLFIALEDSELLGCVFARLQQGSIYIGKLAVLPEQQGKGIGRGLVQVVEEFARQTGYSALELETRIELNENHETFAALGFRKIGEHAHDGYEHATFITMRKELEVHDT